MVSKKFILTKYNKLKIYLKTCKYISWLINVFTIILISLSIYTIITKYESYNCYYNAYKLNYDLDIIHYKNNKCGAYIKNDFISLINLGSSVNNVSF